jgi:regulator of cell morphogenesis and NO signaling
MRPDTNQSVREIAIEHPATVHVFESLGIDYCCGGKRPLKEACDRAGVPVERAVELLAAVEEPQEAEAANWKDASAQALIEHIVEQHHAYVRRETPHLNTLMEKVVKRHGPAHPEVVSIRDLFGALSEELAAHMLKEEHILFPAIRNLESASEQGQAPPPMFFGSVEVPISRMLADHDDAGELLARMRALSSGYAAPADACPTYRALYHGLDEFERDLHQHVHLENNLLFPRALHIEKSLAEGEHARQ